MSIAERTVIAYINGDLVPPSHLRVFVERYQQYDTMIRDLESYPRSIDKTMDTIYDTLVAVLS